MNKRYLTRQEAAVHLSACGLLITKNTLQKFATVGGGPKYAIFGNRALYTPENLQAWARRGLMTRSQVHERESLMAPAQMGFNGKLG